jgi:hypothetical protein
VLFLNLDSNEKEILLEDPVSYIMKVFWETSLKKANVTEIPFWLLYHGRTEADHKSLGLFLDCFPAIYHVLDGKIIGGLDFIKANYRKHFLAQALLPLHEKHNMKSFNLLNIKLIFDDLFQETPNNIELITVDEKYLLTTNSCQIDASLENGKLKLVLPVML